MGGRIVLRLTRTSTLGSWEGGGLMGEVPLYGDASLMGNSLPLGPY